MNAPFAPPLAQPLAQIEKIERDPDDHYPTPAYATLALLEHETFDGDIWDSCCGDGEMIIALKWLLANANKFIASDLNDHGYGWTGRDFLHVDVSRPVVNNLITNPPFRDIDVMIRHAIAASRRKTAILARLAILEGGKRYALFEQNPPSRVHIFTERVTMYSRRQLALMSAAGEKPRSSKTACAWFIWDKQSDDHMVMSLIRPGRKHAYADVTRRIRSALNERYIARHGL